MAIFVAMLSDESKLYCSNKEGDLAVFDLARRAMHALAFLGLDARVKGFLDSGLDAWTKSGRPTMSVPQISVEELRKRLEIPEPYQMNTETPTVTATAAEE